MTFCVWTTAFTNMKIYKREVNFQIPTNSFSSLFWSSIEYLIYIEVKLVLFVIIKIKFSGIENQVDMVCYAKKQRMEILKHMLLSLNITLSII